MSWYITHGNNKEPTPSLSLSSSSPASIHSQRPLDHPFYFRFHNTYSGITEPATARARWINRQRPETFENPTNQSLLTASRYAQTSLLNYSSFRCFAANTEATATANQPGLNPSRRSPWSCEEAIDCHLCPAPRELGAVKPFTHVVAVSVRDEIGKRQKAAAATAPVNR